MLFKIHFHYSGNNFLTIKSLVYHLLLNAIIKSSPQIQKGSPFEM